MNAAREQNAGQSPIEDRLIDRLVDGELPDAERRALLLQLDGHPNGWRRLAIAFLEAQTFREATQPLAAPPAAPTEVIRPAAEVPRRFRFRSYAAVAASLLATFGLGWFLKDTPSGNTPATSVAEIGVPTPSARPNLESGEAVALRDDPAPEAGATGDELAELVKKAEQRGYTAEWQKSKLSLELKDGRKVEVPVREVRLHYDAGRTY